MKKTISIAISLLLIVCCLAACGNSKKIDGAELYTDLGGGEYQVLTDKDGGIERDSDGNLIVAVTDEDGKQVTDENGGKVTETSKIDHALVINNTIELQDFYLTIPEGWSNNSSYQGIQIIKDNSEERITIELLEGQKIEEVQENCQKLIDAAKSSSSNAEPISKTVEIAGENCSYFGVYAPGDADRNPLYFVYTLYETEDGVYRFMITAEENIDANDSEIMSIINSVQFK